MTQDNFEVSSEKGTDAKTVHTYNIGAKGYAEKYESMGARRKDVDRGFSFINKAAPLVVELGCGNGREEAVILEKTERYIGVDVSQNMIEIALRNIPEANFIVSDAVNYNFPQNTDIVFAFASLLHLDRIKMGQLFKKISQALGENGILYIYH